jgi:hypothetical protein
VATISATEIRDVGSQDRMRLSRDDGIEKVPARVTTLGKVACVTVRTEG